MNTRFQAVRAVSTCLKADRPRRALEAVGAPRRFANVEVRLLAAERGPRQHLADGFEMLARAASAGEEPGFDVREATRRAHSLKGAARAVGLEEVESAAHRLESLFIQVEKGETLVDDDLRRFIIDSLDDIEDRVVAGKDAEATDSARSRRPEVRHRWAANPHLTPARCRRMPSHPSTPRTGEAAASEPAKPAVAVPARPRRRCARFLRAGQRRQSRQAAQSASELHADMLLQNLNSQEVSRLGAEIATLESQWNRTWKQIETTLRRGDRVNGSNLLAGGDHLASEIKGLSKRLRAAAQRQIKGARSLHHHLDDLERRVRSARTMPAESVFGSFRKMIRDLAGSEGKQIEVVIEGLDCEADRLVLQRVKDPVMHILRNAISHGIEPPEERERNGKPARGRVALRVSNDHDRLNILIEDDGRGIDFRRVADRAVETGRLTREEAAAASNESLMRLVFEPGFSTAATVTKISGRGVGLSVARDTVTALQGGFDVRSKSGEGTRIELSLPVSVLSRRLLLVSFKDQIYALPTESVARVLRVAPDDLITIEGRPAVRRADSTLPLVSIGEVLGLGDPMITSDASGISVVVVRAGAAGSAGAATHLGIAVEGFVGVNDFVVRNVDIGQDEARLWSGIIGTEDGSPCLVLNPSAFIRREFGSADIVFRKEKREVDRAKVVLVVDDSITTRTLEKSILEAHGYEVRLSVDGRNALTILRSDPPDIVVSDIEMPHVDGFELVRVMKSDKALSEIPVILVTSRSDDEDREKGLKLGADAYVVKQKFDQNELLRTIRQII